MTIFSFPIRFSWGTVAVAILAGIFSGVSSTALIILINTALSGQSVHMTALAVGFVGLYLLRLSAGIVSQVLLLRLSYGAAFDIRMHLCRRILAAPLRDLEEAGKHRLLASLTEDVSTIANALSGIPSLCINAPIVIVCVIYLAWLSWQMFLILAGFMVLGIAIYQLISNRGARYLKQAREDWDALFKLLEAMTGGAKELKLHCRRREFFFSNLLEQTANSVSRNNTAGMSIYVAAGSWGNLLMFAFIGFLVFGLANTAMIDRHAVMGATLTVLYMIGPLGASINEVPSLARAAVVLRKLQSLRLSLLAEVTDASVSALTNSDLCFKSLELDGVTHTYHNEAEDRSFTLGPIDMTFSPGELVFLVGGNGSGKTTLAKLLTGLYTSESGEVRLNGEVIDNSNREYYRQYFSVVFSDFYLFERLIGLEEGEVDARARDYLNQLQLSHKVKVDGGVLSTTELSQGQRKRLALLTAYLEDRPFYIFDEWAADQDPLFKNIFYTQILPDLKSRGKTIMVITHDDQYYHLADRTIKLDCGKLERVTSATECLPC